MYLPRFLCWAKSLSAAQRHPARDPARIAGGVGERESKCRAPARRTLPVQARDLAALRRARAQAQAADIGGRKRPVPGRDGLLPDSEARRDGTALVAAEGDLDAAD